MEMIITTVMEKILTLPGIIIGLSFHEAAHAFMSHKLGDPTPENQGRLTINPIAHIDVIGFISLILFGFGWGKPVMINPRYYKHPRRDEFLVSIAGVTVNLVIAIVFSLITKGVAAVMLSTGTFLSQALYTICIYVVMINLVLMIFNLIPLPPLDGFGIVTQLFKLDTKPWYEKFYNYGTPILLVMIVFNLTGKIISPAVTFLMSILGL